jgi:methyltransferase (TIGR00027 family)
MEKGQPSLTAVAAAITRAAHLFLDPDPKVFVDNLALGLSGAETEATLQARLAAQHAELSRHFPADFAYALLKYLRALMTMRSRYVEEELRVAIQRGVTQYVILGAGLDSFAYRRRDLADVVHVFEVDHPVSQDWKRARLEALGIALPPNLTFVPIDFETQTLLEGLRREGYQEEQPGFFSWLGVTQYLTEEAIRKTLQAVASLAPGTEIIFEYTVPESLLEAEGQRVLAAFKVRGAARGEPWLSLFEPTRLRAWVQELGFAEALDLSPKEANTRYFSGRTDGLHVPPTSHLMSARVARR